MITEEQQRIDVVAEARTWVGTPYHHEAKIKGAGVDCAQILIEVYANTGVIQRFETAPYPPDWMLHKDEERYLNTIKMYASEVLDPMPGDIALFKFGRCVSHGSIIIRWPLIIHAYAQEGEVCYGDGESGHLRGRFAGYYSPWVNK